MEALRLHGEPGRDGDELPALPEWREYAACRDEPSDTFFDETAEGVAEARRICDHCPVRAECRREALAMPWLVGVFGGLTQMERLQMRRGEPVVDQPRAERRPPAAPRQPKPHPEPQPCGTTAAYARHRRNGEDACAECKEARRLKSAEVKRQRRERAREAREGQEAPEAA